jgi:hypothetical protein
MLRSDQVVFNSSLYYRDEEKLIGGVFVRFRAPLLQRTLSKAAKLRKVYCGLGLRLNICRTLKLILVPEYNYLLSFPSPDRENPFLVLL